MRLLQRWATSVSASFETVVNQLENHEALVTSAIREMQSAEAKARAQLTRIARDGENMRRRIVGLAEMDRVWEERAVAVHNSDKERALECLRRKKQGERERAHLEQQLIEHSRIELQLKADLKVIADRIAELKRKKHQMTAREYRAQAMKAGQLQDIGLIAEIDEIFDRWELRLGECEYMNGNADTFEQQFAAEETEKELESMLDTLVRPDAQTPQGEEPSR